MSTPLHQGCPSPWGSSVHPPVGGSPPPVLPASPFQNGGVSTFSRLGCIPKTSGLRPPEGRARKGGPLVLSCAPNTLSSPSRSHVEPLPARPSPAQCRTCPSKPCLSLSTLQKGVSGPRGEGGPHCSSVSPLLLCGGIAFHDTGPSLDQRLWKGGPLRDTPHPPQCSDPGLRGTRVTGCPGPPPCSALCVVLATMNQQLSFTPGLLQAGDPGHSGSGD